MGFYSIKPEKKKEEEFLPIACPKCKSLMIRSGILGDDMLHVLNGVTGVFHSQINVFGSTVYRCKKCQIVIVVLMNPAFKEGYI